METKQTRSKGFAYVVGDGLEMKLTVESQTV